MEVAFQIPIVGVLLQLVGYLVDIIPGLGPLHRSRRRADRAPGASVA